MQAHALLYGVWKGKNCLLYISFIDIECQGVLERMKGDLKLFSRIKRPLIEKFTATSLSLLSNISDDQLTWLTYLAEKIPPKDSYREKMRWIRELFTQKHPSLEVARWMLRESNPVQRKNIAKFLVNQFLEGTNRTKDFESRTDYCPPRSLHPKNRLTPQREPSF